MTKLNLISPQQKDRLTVDYLHALIENGLGIFVIIAIIFAIILIPLSENLVILEYQNQRTREIATSKNQDITAKINPLDGQIDAYSTLLNSRYNWSALLIELSQLVPENISLSQFTAASDNLSFVARGYAANRDDLITFISNLDRSTVFVDIESPLENYLQQKAVEFELRGKISNKYAEI